MRAVLVDLAVGVLLLPSLVSRVAFSARDRGSRSGRSLLGRVDGRDGQELVDADATVRVQDGSQARLFILGGLGVVRVRRRRIGGES